MLYHRRAIPTLLVLLLAVPIIASGGPTEITSTQVYSPALKGDTLTLGSGTPLTIAYNTASGRWEWTGTDQQLNVNHVFGTNKGIILKSNSTAPGQTLGQISRGITCQALTHWDRCWIAWTDQDGRNKASIGWHNYTAAGDKHDGWELKTPADRNGSYSADMRTRIQIQSDIDYSRATFQWLDMMELNAGPFRTADTVGVELRMQDWNNVSRKLFQSTAQVDPSGNTIVNLDPGSMVDGANSTTLRLFRTTNTASAALTVYAANDTNTETFKLDARTGDIQRVGNMNLIGASPAARWKTNLNGIDTDIARIQSIVGASGESILNVDPTSQNSSAGAHLRAFRNTNTSGIRTLTLFKGDGTNTETLKLDAAKGDITKAANITATGNLTTGPLTRFQNATGITGLKVNLQSPTSSDLTMYPPGLYKRTRIEHWDRPENETPLYRPLSIESHGPNDPDSADYHVSVYSHNGTSHEQKILEWHWGPGWSDKLKVFPNLHAFKQIWANGTIYAMKNSTATTATSYPTVLNAYNGDTTAGNGATIAFAGDDTGGAVREYAGIRGHFVDHDTASADGELSFWISIGNTRREVSRVNATAWQINKTLDALNVVANRPVTETATTLSVTLDVPEPYTGYAIACTPSWGTTVWVTGKTTTGYTVNFGTAAPASATVDCILAR